MPRTCTICTHPERPAIDAALVAGTANRRIAAQHAVSEQAVRRHQAEHVPAKLAKAQEAREVAQADDLLRDVRVLRGKAVALLLKAEQAGDLRTALAGVREARGCVELLAKLAGELDERPVVNVLVAPEWLGVRAALLEALTPYPEARAAVSDRLLTLGAAHGRG